MRKTSAFLAAFLFTASFTGSVWSVSAEETAVETEKPATAQTQNSESKPEENSGTENTESEENKQSETETTESSSENEQNAGEPEEEEPKEEHAALKKFVKGVTENEDQANELMNKLLAREMNAADAVRDFFSKKNYDDTEEGRKQFIADLCKYVYMNDGEFDREYAAKKAFFDFGVSRDYFLMRFVLSDIFNNFCNDEGIDRGNIPITENRDKNPQVTGYVQKLYNIVLGRRADTDGLNNWTGEIINNGKTAAGVLASFLNSEEFRNKNTSNEDYAAVLFRMCRDTDPDGETLNGFVSETLAKGHTREAVLRKFVRSDEFTKYCEDRKINRGDIEVGGWTTNADGFKCYYSPDTGLMQRGHVLVDGIPCYFDNDGTLRTDWSDLKNIVPAKADVYTFTEMERNLASLQQQYPSLVRIGSLGATFDGRQIYDLIIGNADAEKQIVIKTGSSAAEAELSRVLLADAENFLKNYRTGEFDGKAYTELYDKCCVHIIPMSNPDGISIGQFGADGMRNPALKARVRSIYLSDLKAMEQKITREEYFALWKANALGVDLSMNDSGYAGTAKSKNSPSSSGYAGTSKDSEAEIKAFGAFKKEHESAEYIPFTKFSESLQKNGTALPELMTIKNEASNSENEKTSDQKTEEVSTGTKEEVSVFPVDAMGASHDEKELSAYVDFLYHRVFGRDPDREGFVFWNDTLESGKCTPLELVYMFAGSRELERKNISNEEFVKILYRVTGAREPSGEELSKYTGLISDGYSRNYVMSRIIEVQADEFKKTCERFGLETAAEGSEGWNDGPEGRYYVQNGIRVRDDLRNLDGFTFYFDKNGYLSDGNCKIGSSQYYVKDGYLITRKGFDWEKEFRSGNIRSDSGRAFRMDVPVDYQFLYNRVICTFGGEDKRVRESGCGATSASMVMRYLTGRNDETFNPEYLFEWAYKNGEYFGYGLAESTITKFLSMAGLDSYWIDPSAEKVTRALRAGRPVIALVREGYFTSSGHYIVLTGVTRDGYVTVNDPNNSSMGRMEYKLSTVISQAKCFMICGISEENDNKPEEEPKQTEPAPGPEPVVTTAEEPKQTEPASSPEPAVTTVEEPKQTEPTPSPEPAVTTVEEPKQTEPVITTVEEPKEPEIPEEQKLKNSFVKRLYNIVLDREPDASEIDLWTGRLDSGDATADSALFRFFNSDEYKRKNTSDEDFINALYLAATENEAEDIGRDYWKLCLKQGWLRAGVVKQFTMSEKFAALCEKYGIKRGTFDAGGWSKNSDGGVVYCDHESGKPYTGYNVVNNINCYFDESGVLRTDWSNLKSFVDTSSAMYTYEEMVSDINGLKEQYPSLVSIDTLATTADGRPIYDMVIGNRNSDRQIIVHGGCHAREYMGCMLVMNQAEFFLKHYWNGSYSGRSYRELLENYQIHIIPMLNPDGVTLSQKGLDGIRSAELKAGIQEIYRKDLSEGVTGLGLDSYLRSWKANAKGVDINRNFPVPEWSYQDGIIGRPSSAKYNGPSAGSEIETKAVTDLVNSLSGCKAVISYHSSGSMIYWQYHQSGNFLERSRTTANALRNITGYYLLYGENSGGGCSNWVADVKNIFACTIEIGSGDSPLGISQYSGIWNANRDVLPYILSAY